MQFARNSGTVRIFYVRDVSPGVLFDAVGVVDKHAFERDAVVVILLPRCREDVIVRWVSFEHVCRRERSDGRVRLVAKTKDSGLMKEKQTQKGKQTQKKLPTYSGGNRWAHWR